MAQQITVNQFINDAVEIMKESCTNNGVDYQEFITKLDDIVTNYTPAYYEAEGGSMCNGIGRSYF